MGSFTQAECRLCDHQFFDKFFEQNVYFYVLSGKDNFFLWVGESSPKLSQLAVAMQTKYDSMPAATGLMGDRLDPTSSNMAQKLAKKTKKQVFLSYNLPSSDLQLLSLVEKRIQDEMKTHPEAF